MKILSLLFILSLLTACGFTPRQANLIPQELRQLHLVYNSQTQALADSVEVLGRNNDISFVSSHPITLNLQTEKVTRRLLSVFASGQVAEYELDYEVIYSLSVNGESVTFSIQILRDYQDDPKQVLAKSLELELIMQELRDKAAEQLLRTLSNNYQNALLNQSAYAN